jgi:membrane associated rhomboid family serine protease
MGRGKHSSQDNESVSQCRKVLGSWAAVTQPMSTCYRHPNNRAGVSCQRCDRPICGTCMTTASVGFQCPECIKGAAKKSPVIRFSELRSGRPIVTEVLIALNVLGLIAVVATGGSLFNGGGRATEQGMTLGQGAMYSFSGNRATVEFLGVAYGQWWRIITGGFLHSGLLHFGMNMLLLYLLGKQLEPLLGKARFAALYVACLVGGSFGALLVSPTVGTVGASGIDVWRNGIGGLVVINVLLTFAVPGIAIGAHIGGLIIGVAVGALVFGLDRAVRSPWAGTMAALGVTAVLWIGCLVAASRVVS